MPSLLEYQSPARRQPAVLAEAVLKQHCEDFRVQELPSYEPSGEGEHLFLWVQKTDCSAARLLQVLSQQLKVSQRDIGVAGQKDRRAMTQQYVSVPATCEAKVESFQDDRIQILRAKRHGNKLRTGHTVGNRFQITLRPQNHIFDEANCKVATQRLRELSETGFPNYYGVQRFGVRGESVDKGIQLLTGSSSKRKAVRASRFERKMMLSAVQSAVFNLVTNWRVKDGTVGEPTEGDVVCRRDGIRPFLYSKRKIDETAMLIPMGPMPGSKMVASEGDVLANEQKAMLSLGLQADDFNDKKSTPGARRPMLAWPTECSCELTDCGSIQVHFQLPSGCYATVLLREIVETIHSGPFPT